MTLISPVTVVLLVAAAVFHHYEIAAGVLLGLSLLLELGFAGQRAQDGATP